MKLDLERKLEDKMASIFWFVLDCIHKLRSSFIDFLYFKVQWYLMYGKRNYHVNWEITIVFSIYDLILHLIAQNLCNTFSACLYYWFRCMTLKGFYTIIYKKKNCWTTHTLGVFFKVAFFCKQISSFVKILETLNIFCYSMIFFVT